MEFTSLGILNYTTVIYIGLQESFAEKWIVSEGS